MPMSEKTHISAVTTAVPPLDYKIPNSVEEVPEDGAAEDGDPARGNWTGRFDFLLSLLGYSVGLGNVWRFPYLCYNNGGGAFLIPFTVMLIIAGLPLMFMELSFGQYAALGPVAVYNRFCPLFRGLGYGMVIVSSIVMLYYNLIIAWTIYYMAVSFVSIFYQLPWQTCGEGWSTQYCYSYEEADKCEADNGTYYLRQCFNRTHALRHNISALADVALRRPPAEEYFTNQVLGLSAGIEETGQVRPGMAVCLFVAWLIVFLCLCKGVQSSGKVVYFTALFPYVVLVILFFRGVTLPGASTGILFYLTPDFSRLLNAQVWGDAAVQIFFALSPAWGGLITLSSYNKFTNNCYIDSLIVAVSNIATSFFAGLVIFSVIGFLAHELDVEVDRVVDQGAGLAFIVYPEVVTRLPVSPLWSILFFVMLLTLGLDSQFALMETVTTAILDRFPSYRHKKVWVVLAVAVFGYLGGLIFTTNSGMYWLQLMDKYAANWSVLIIAIGECVLIAWIYGAEKFCEDIQQMIGRQSRLWVWFWSAMWRVVTPATLIFILVFNWIEYQPASYGHYVYPMWADAVGWAIGVLPVVVVVLMAVDQICSGPDDLTIMETSQDAGDSCSIASGFENELKKIGPALIKSTRNSLKKKVHTLSMDSDDAAIEPLLQKEKGKVEIANHSAKYTLSKAKTEKAAEKDKGKEELRSLIENEKSQASNNGIMTHKPEVTSVAANGFGNQPNKTFATSVGHIHNHMNTNVFGGINDGASSVASAPKTQTYVEIDTSKSLKNNSGPLIFTTAKIHTDGKTKQMEPVVASKPISSIVECTIKNESDNKCIENNIGKISGQVAQDSEKHNNIVLSSETCNNTSAGSKPAVSLSSIKRSFEDTKISSFAPTNAKVISSKDDLKEKKLETSLSNGGSLIRTAPQSTVTSTTTVSSMRKNSQGTAIPLPSNVMGIGLGVNKAQSSVEELKESTSVAVKKETERKKSQEDRDTMDRNKNVISSANSVVTNTSAKDKTKSSFDVKSVATTSDVKRLDSSRRLDATKQLQRQKSSNVDDGSISAAVGNRHATITSSLSKEPTSSVKLIKNKSTSVENKDIKDQKPSIGSARATTKTMNVTTLAKTSSAPKSTASVKQSGSSGTSGLASPTSQVKPVLTGKQGAVSTAPPTTTAKSVESQVSKA